MSRIWGVMVQGLEGGVEVHVRRFSGSGALRLQDGPRKALRGGVLLAGRHNQIYNALTSPPPN